MTQGRYERCCRYRYAAKCNIGDAPLRAILARKSMTVEPVVGAYAGLNSLEHLAFET